jgi:hypothetical protein
MALAPKFESICKMNLQDYLKSSMKLLPDLFHSYLQEQALLLYPSDGFLELVCLLFVYLDLTFDNYFAHHFIQIYF